jgi:hypothetical protein
VLYATLVDAVETRMEILATETEALQQVQKERPGNDIESYRYLDKSSILLCCFMSK